MNDTAPDVIWYDQTVRWMHPAMPRPEQLPVVEYVRADLVRAAMPANWRDGPETLALGKTLNMTANAVLSRPGPEGDK